MRVVKQSVEVMDKLDGKEILKKLETAGRVCYKSEDRIGEGTAEKFIKAIVDRGHESVLEHVSITVKFIVDRGVSHQLVRHRIASYSQESTRYCNYSKDGFGGSVAFVQPSFAVEGTEGYDLWKKSCEDSEKAYFDLLNFGWTPEQARNVLSHSIKTEVVATMNLRQWRHFIKLRTDRTAHPQIREVATMLQEQLRREVPIVFE
jgi:thymidylate synthase (FAD)